MKKFISLHIIVLLALSGCSSLTDKMDEENIDKRTEFVDFEISAVVKSVDGLDISVTSESGEIILLEFFSTPVIVDSQGKKLELSDITTEMNIIVYASHISQKSPPAAAVTKIVVVE